MTNFDVEYLRLVKKILNEGVEVENRTGINTIKIPSYSFEFDLSKEFPILQTKSVAWKSSIIEMLWIWQMGSNKVQDLHDRGVDIWDEWMIDEDGIYRIYEPKIPGKEYEYIPDKEVVVLDPLSTPLNDPFGETHPLKPKLDETGKVMTTRSTKEGMTIKSAKYYGKELAGTIGKAYGYNNNRYGMMESTQNKLKNNPYDRRKVNNLWQLEYMREAVLPPCVYCNRWDVTDGKLNVTVEQRSCDVPLGLPFNITQYAAMLRMLAQTTNLEPGKMNYNITDAHIYVNQLEGIEEQIRREEKYYELSRESAVNLLLEKKKLEKELLFLDKESEEYKVVSSDIRIIDLILEPTKPELWLDSSIDDFFKFDNSKELKHVKVKKYKHMGKITMPIAQ